MIEIDVFHTQERRESLLVYPILAEGHQQWLGDGFYFWEDIEFAHFWGKTKKTKKGHFGYSIYSAKIQCEADEIIDTVFNEEDYRRYVSNVEKFANLYSLNNDGKKPSIFDFNEFISDVGIWHDIKVIRFQDMTTDKDHSKVKGFHYKKRIQLKVNDSDKISNFALFFDDSTKQYPKY